MNKSRGRVQAGSVPVRRGGRGGQFTSGGGAVYYVAKCPGGHSTTGGRLLRDSPSVGVAHARPIILFKKIIIDVPRLPCSSRNCMRHSVPIASSLLLVLYVP